MTETCEDCKKEFDMAKEYNGRYLTINRKTIALCGSCAEDSVLMW
jgi:hypothetical protein